MNGTRKLALAVAVGLLAAGCATPTAEQTRAARQARVRAEGLLQEFAVAVRSKSPTQLKPLLGPSVTPSRFLKLALQLEGASWLPRYQGYELRADRALRDVGWTRWNSGRVALSIPAENADGDRFKDRFVLKRGQEGWHIEDFTLQTPEAGDVVYPPEEVRDQIRPQVQHLVRSLEEGHVGEVYYSMPDDRRYRFRQPQLTFWQSLTLPERPGSISIFTDLQIIEDLSVASWPDASAPMELEWVGHGALRAVYDVPYLLSGEGETDMLRVELLFLRNAQEWKFHQVRFHGEAIPYS